MRYLLTFLFFCVSLKKEKKVVKKITKRDRKKFPNTEKLAKAKKVTRKLPKSVLSKDTSQKKVILSFLANQN